MHCPIEPRLIDEGQFIKYLIGVPAGTDVIVGVDEKSKNAVRQGYTGNLAEQIGYLPMGQ